MEKSSGAVIYKNDKYLLLKYSMGHWGFVKGHVENKESEEETLFRETKEETGLTKENLKLIDGFKEKINYYFKKDNKKIYKEVVFFLLESKTNNITLSHEHDDYLWLPYKDAYDKLTFKNSKNLLKKANDFVEK